MKKLSVVLCCSLMLGASTLAYADALSVGNITIDVRLNSDNLIPEGIVWQSSRLFTDSASFGSFLPKDNASLVLTDDPNVGLGFLQPRIDEVAQSLPVSLGSTGLYLTFVGSVNGTWGNTTLEWSPSNYEEAYTTTFTTNLVQHHALVGGLTSDTQSKSGTISYKLWPVIYCKNPSKGGCEVPSNAVSVKDYYIRLYSSGLFASGLATQIIEGGTLNFEVGCEFSISPTSFTDIELKTHNNGDILDTRQSTYSASCSRNGSLYVIFTPSAGLWENDLNHRVGLTNIQGIGVIHRNSTEAPTSLNQCDSWSQTQKLGSLKSTGNSKRSIEGTVHWGFYQYLNVPLTGNLDTSVNYEFWVE